MAKKRLKQLEVTIYTNKIHLTFWQFNHNNLIIKHALIRGILCWVTTCVCV